MGGGFDIPFPQRVPCFWGGRAVFPEPKAPTCEGKIFLSFCHLLMGHFSAYCCSDFFFLSIGHSANPNGLYLDNIILFPVFLACPVQHSWAL